MKLIDFKDLYPVKGISYSRDHLRRKVKAGEFPKPIQLSPHRIAWIELEVDEHLATKERARQETSAPNSTAPRQPRPLPQSKIHRRLSAHPQQQPVRCHIELINDPVDDVHRG